MRLEPSQQELLDMLPRLKEKLPEFFDDTLRGEGFARWYTTLGLPGRVISLEPFSTVIGGGRQLDVVPVLVIETCKRAALSRGIVIHHDLHEGYFWFWDRRDGVYRYDEGDYFLQALACCDCLLDALKEREYFDGQAR